MKNRLKNVPKAVYIIFILSIILLIPTVKIYDKQENKIKNKMKEETVVISDVYYYYESDNTDFSSSKARTKITFIVDGKEYTVRYDSHDYNIGDTIEVYKYKDKYYNGSGEPTFKENIVLSIILMSCVLGITICPLYFLVCIFGTRRSKNA